MRADKKPRTLRFAQGMQKKLIFVSGLLFLVLMGLFVRLAYIQTVKGSEYELIVLNQQGYSSESLVYRRGDILDTNGVVLATSQDVYNLVLDCKVINSDEAYVEPTIAALLLCFPQLTEEEIRTALTEKSTSQYCVLLKKLTYDEIQAFLELEEEVYIEGSSKGKKVNPNVQGVWFEKQYSRLYPYDSLACKVLGFTTSGNEGMTGLEKQYSEVLNGINGRSYTYLNTAGILETVTQEATDGYSIVTTLDVNIQSIVEEKIAAFNEAHTDEATVGPGSANTAVIVMNPNTGEILAMADSTGFDLNDPWNSDALTTYCVDYYDYTWEEAEELDENTRLVYLNALWQNFCITTTYEPGSTVKPLTMAAALEMGVVSDGDTFLCDGGETISGTYISCANKTGHGIETLAQVIMNSCNDGMMQIAAKLGISSFVKYQNIFNIGLRTNIDLPGEAKTSSLIYTEERMNQDATALPTNSFGQNFNVTMIQVISAFSSVINGGYYYQPYLVKEIVDSNGAIVESITPTLLKQTVSQETSDLLKSYLVAAVEEGTAKTAKVAGYSMGGKTGTAEKYPRGNGNYLVSFIGFAPAEDPQVVIYVVIDEPNVSNQAQSSLATTLAEEILEEILPYLNIFPDEETEDGE